MKKFKQILLGLLSTSLALFFGFCIYESLIRDTTPPVITCPQEVLVASVSVTEEELLAQVSALDDKDGDLTANVVVENLSTMEGDDTRQITYAVMDLSGNVGRATRSLHYTDYELPHLHLSVPLRIDSPSKLTSLLDSMSITSILDGDLTSHLKFHIEGSNPVFVNGFYNLEIRADDSAGNSMVIPALLEVYDPHEETIQVELTDYILYLHVGDPFDPAGYFKSASQPGKLTVDSDVDPSVPGVYHVTYTVTDESTDDFGISRLIVVVEA